MDRKQIGIWTEEHRNIQTEIKIDQNIDEQKNRWTDRWFVRKAVGQKDGWTNTQIDTDTQMVQ